MRKFTMIDQAFTCTICGCQIDRLGYTARDHCPHCLSSLHLDINPGDRASECKGVLKAVGIEKYKNTYKIVYQCQTCGEIKRNIAATDDNMELIIELSANPLPY